VTEAAKRLGVGRPGLSNLLNGKASLSPEMAIRLEKAFGANPWKLLDLQAQCNHDTAAQGGKNALVRSYVPSFLTIKARQISDWAANNLEARQHLPVLLRMLIHSTGRELRHVDFPGYDNAERKGPDGLIDAASATAWIPEGRSVWEFGTTQTPATKAEGDYAARLGSMPSSERADLTFVFVTPHNWPGKAEWAKGKKATGDWKAVRALDASDLEQWLEESIPAQIWLAEKLNLPNEGCETLDQCWHRWSMASEPQLTPAIFSQSVMAHRADFKRWFDSDSERLFIVAADSRDEALAFLACLFQDRDMARWKDLAGVFHNSKALRTLASSTSMFLPIVTSDEAERELAPLYRHHHCIAVRPRNTVESEPDIALDLLGYDAFRKALADMGIEEDRADFLDRESGRSPTILRRRLSKIDAIRTPRWLSEAATARDLIPMTFVGAWHAESKADCEVIHTLAEQPYQKVEEDITRLLAFDDSPVWSIGQYRGVTSKIDSLFAINKSITKKDLTDFFTLAEYVLSETDPALDLPEDRRWAAGIYGKVRDHSAALRKGICETLVILSVHGNHLFQDRLGINAEDRVSSLIARLLTPLTLQKLLSHDNDLPRYAEAAPDTFLKILEADLKKPEPVISGLLKPARSSGLFGGCPRSGLLWALECLAWKPQNLTRVTSILAQLSKTEIDDNWANKPIASLGAIFRWWMPQTAACLEDRIRALEMLANRFPEIGWQICIEQFEPGPQSGHHSYRPLWRSDASGFGQPDTSKQYYDFAMKALDLALAWPARNERTLGDLVERLQGLDKEDQIAIWDLIDRWADTSNDDRAKADLRERIRRFAFTRRARRQDIQAVTADRARRAYDKLRPHDLVIRHGWLFLNSWVQESLNEIHDADFDFSKHEERVHKLRVDAFQEIWTERGFEGVAALLSGSGTPFVVGRYAQACVRPETTTEFLRQCLGLGADLAEKADGCIQGFLAFLDAEARSRTLAAVSANASLEQIVRIFRCAPFGQETWDLLNQYGDEIRDRYWRDVVPGWNRHTDAELNELIDRLLEAQRPRAAFQAVHMHWSKIETSRLKRLLLAVATTDAEPKDAFRLAAHDISDALEALNGRPGVTTEEMAQFEFLYISALNFSKHGIPNLGRQIARSPAFFIQALALLYRRDDGGQDPPEWRIDDPDRREAAALSVHRLFDQTRCIPGTGDDGQISTRALRAWVSEVRQLSAQHGRSEIGDYHIGQLLSKASGESTGAWPCVPVCDVMEEFGSRRMAEGFLIGVRNARGAHWRGEGGDQERDFAAKYRRWAQQAAFDYPFVGSVLEDIASSYDAEAGWHDTEAQVRKRLGH